MKRVIPGTVYKHYKGNLYQVIGIGTHTETLEKMVIYKEISKNMGKYRGGRDTENIWIRPQDMFMGKVSGRDRFIIYNGKI